VYISILTTGKTDFADGRKSKPSAKNLFADGRAVGEKARSVKNLFADDRTVDKKHRRQRIFFADGQALGK
jgi:hypothetical protein